jgi:hypothetical protein
MYSLRPPLITEHHSVSSLNDPGRERSPCSRYLRPARDVDTTCAVRRNVHESLAIKVRAHRAPNSLRACVGRSHVDHTEARNDLVGCFRRSDRRAHVIVSCPRENGSSKPARVSCPRAFGRMGLGESMDKRATPLGPDPGGLQRLSGTIGTRCVRLPAAWPTPVECGCPRGRLRGAREESPGAAPRLP